ncbi:MAG: glycoside hydrolase family 108 protein [Vampirovibrionales bacterium]
MVSTISNLQQQPLSNQALLGAIGIGYEPAWLPNAQGQLSWHDYTLRFGTPTPLPQPWQSMEAAALQATQQFQQQGLQQFPPQFGMQPPQPANVASLLNPSVGLPQSTQAIPTDIEQALQQQGQLYNLTVVQEQQRQLQQTYTQALQQQQLQLQQALQQQLATMPLITPAPPLNTSLNPSLMTPTAGMPAISSAIPNTNVTMDSTLQGLLNDANLTASQGGQQANQINVFQQQFNTITAINQQLAQQVRALQAGQTTAVASTGAVGIASESTTNSTSSSTVGKGNSGQTFDDALKIVLKWEGGLSDHPNDTGGKTNKGITHTVYRNWLKKKGRPNKDVSNITDEEVKQIYKEEYWDKINGDTLAAKNPKLAMAMFNAAVNMGTGRAGQIKAKAGENLEAFLDEQERLYRVFASKPGQEVFLKGWMNRHNDVRQKLGAMA